MTDKTLPWLALLMLMVEGVDRPIRLSGQSRTPLVVPSVPLDARD